MPKIVEVPGVGNVEFPDNMDDYHIAAKIRQHLDAIPRDVTQDMSGLQKFGAGMGKAFMDIGRGTGQLVREGIEAATPEQKNLASLIRGKQAPNLADRLGLPTRGDIDKIKVQDANLMNTGAGLAGNIAGNVAAAAPLAFIPGAATIGGGALIGAGSAALQPVGTEDSRGQNMAVSGAFGAALPAAVRAAKVGKAMLVDPFTTLGRERIVGGAVRRAAANPAEASANMAMARGATPGFNPTAGQASNDAGVASLERAARAIDPAGFGDIDQSQRSALVDALRSIAKTPEDRAASVAAVEKQAKDLYGDAFKESVNVTPELTKIAGRPSMAMAEKRAMELADELGIPYQARLKDMRPQNVAVKEHINPSSVETFEDIPSKLIPLGESRLPDARVLEKRAPMDYTDQVDKVIPVGKGPQQYFEVPGQRIPKTLTIPPEPRPTSYMEIPPVDSVPVRDMHTLKMGMDALLSDPTMGIAKREAQAIKATRGQLLDQMPESYQQARLGHIEMNKPVNQMDIGTELYNRFTPALADQGGLPFKSTAGAYANALRNGDKLAANVTGLKGATLESIMEPAQMDLLHGVAKDSATQAASESLGRGVGSDTVQKMAMSNVIDQSGLPSWIGALAPLRSVGGIAKTAGDILYTKNDETMRHLLADVLKDPARAAQAMERAGVPPSKYAEVLKKIGVAGAIGTANTANVQQN